MVSFPEDNNVYGSVTSTRSAWAISRVFMASGWRVRERSFTEFEVWCDYAELEIHPGDRVLIDGVVADPFRNVSRIASSLTKAGHSGSFEIYGEGASLLEQAFGDLEGLLATPTDQVPDVASTPLEVLWRDITDFDQFDDRVSAVTVLFGSVIGVNDGSVQWCSDSSPPPESERLAWIWLCWPHLDAQIMNRARPDHQELLRAYRTGQLPAWWSDRARGSPM